MTSSLKQINRRFCVAPMMDWTDRHCRVFHRHLTRHALLYTEMVNGLNQINATTNANYRVVGLLTDDENVIGSTRAGIPLIGKPEDARLLAVRQNASEVWAVAGGIPGSCLPRVIQGSR